MPLWRSRQINLQITNRTRTQWTVRTAHSSHCLKKDPILPHSFTLAYLVCATNCGISLLDFPHDNAGFSQRRTIATCLIGRSRYGREIIINVRCLIVRWSLQADVPPESGLLRCPLRIAVDDFKTVFSRTCLINLWKYLLLKMFTDFHCFRSFLVSLR